MHGGPGRPHPPRDPRLRGEPDPKEPDRAGVGRVAAADVLPQLAAETRDRPVAPDFRDDRRCADDRVVAVGVVARNDPAPCSCPASDRAGEVTGIGIAGVRVDLVRSETGDQRSERSGLELVELPDRDVLIDFAGAQDDHIALPDRRQFEEDTLSLFRVERLRIPGPRCDEPVNPLSVHEESTHHEGSHDAAAPRFVEAKDPLHRAPLSYIPRLPSLTPPPLAPFMTLDGLVVPVPTLFSDDGSLDLGRNAKFARGLADAKVDHVFVLGSLGEFPSVTDEERERLIDVVVGSVVGSTDVWVGCGAPSTHQAVAYAESAEGAGAAAVVAVPPFYLHPALPSVERYYHALHGSVEIPLLAYNIPSLVGYALPSAFVHALARDHILAGLKDTSGSLASVESFLTGAPGGFPVFPGDDAFASDAIARGAAGAVMGIANIVPRLCIELVAAARAGDRPRAAECQAIVNALVEVGRAAPFPSNMKFLAAELRGAEVGYRAPYDPLTPGEAAGVRERLSRIRERLAPFLVR